MFNDESVGRYLFHYTTAETFLAHILPTLQLRMSPFDIVNDPREAQNRYFVLADDEGNGLEGWNFPLLQIEFDQIVRGEAKVLCFTRDDPDIDAAQFHLRVYRRGWAHSRMWDQYAGHHTGVCLAFSVDTLGGDIAEAVGARGDLISRWVNYEDEPPTADLIAAREIRTSVLRADGPGVTFRRQRDQHVGVWYFYKSTDWASEYEFRWVLLSARPERFEHVPIGHSLAGVIFGPDYPLDSVPMVRQRVGAEVTLAHLTWLNGRPGPTPV